MLPQIKARFTDDVLAQACQGFGVDAASVTKLDAFENLIFGVGGDAPRILRLSHSLRRTPQLLDAEAAWIEYLAENGAPVAKALRSTGGELTVAVVDGAGGAFLCNLFERAPGGILKRGDWTPPFIEAWGGLLGTLHRLTVEYRPPPGLVRYEWDDPAYMEIEEYLTGPEDGMILERLAEVMEHLRGLPTPSSAFGLIHADAHVGNFFVNGGTSITLFDFDDCRNGHFMQDIAIVLWHSLRQTSPHGPEFRDHYYRHFMRGYTAEYSLDPQWLAEIPWFLRLRDLSMFGVLRRTYGDFKADNIEERLRNMMIDCRTRGEERRPLFELDW